MAEEAVINMIYPVQIGPVPVFIAADVAKRLDMTERAFLEEFLKMDGNSGIWKFAGMPAVEFDDLWDFLEFYYPSVFCEFFER